MSWPKGRKGASKNNAEKMHCKHGHEFTSENTIWKDAPTASGKMRVCRQCKARRDTERRRKRGQLAKQPPTYVKMRRKDALVLYEWLREPDYAEDFSLDKIVDWINRRPITIVAAAVDAPAVPNGEH